ncbi:MAG: 50S ribosomal protein L15 [Candidatus Omnitrophica bacterium]|nr:50S ribosomal protein L15 [Candidatus Omnitrophota bacterium]
MRLNDLTAPAGANKRRKRVGRGMGSGHGKTSCRGHKGQKARSGSKLRPGFEGGQMPLARRLPKRGFRNPFKIKYQILNIEKLNRFKKDSTVTPQILKEQGLIKNENLPVKVLSMGKISKALNIQTQAVSKAAKIKIEKAGGKIELITGKQRTVTSE